MEKLMQYVWQHRLYASDDMVTNDGRRVRVIDTGMLNTDAGPDFFTVAYGQEMWRCTFAPVIGADTGTTATAPTTR